MSDGSTVYLVGDDQFLDAVIDYPCDMVDMGPDFVGKPAASHPFPFLLQPPQQQNVRNADPMISAAALYSSGRWENENEKLKTIQGQVQVLRAYII